MRGSIAKLARIRACSTALRRGDRTTLGVDSRRYAFARGASDDLPALVVLNAEKIHLTGRKLQNKQYRWHTGYIGGLREVSAEKMLKTHPERVIEWAVQGMLPKNRLGRAMAKKLKVYRGAAHPHQAQQPQVLEVK